MAKIDVNVHNEGTVFVLNPLTTTAKNWVKENVQLESWQKWAGDAFVVEHRFAMQIVKGMQAAGLRVV
jgi:hypothetical protein